MFNIGIMVDSLKMDIMKSISKASEMGSSGIQVYAVNGPMAPENLSSKARKELLDVIKSHGLVVAAVCGDLGGYGFTIREQNEWKIKKSKEIMDLALDLEADVITTHIGVIPEEKSHERWGVLQEACGMLGEYGEKTGAAFAIETGPEKATTLKKFIDTVGNKGIKVNYDPANFVMVTDEDCVKGVFTLKDYIVHTHAKDGIMLRKGDPEVIYRHLAEGGIGDINLEEYFREVPLGEGKVDFDSYLKALDNIGYNGFLTIEREVGEDPEKDIRQAVEFLRCKIVKNFKK